MFYLQYESIPTSESADYEKVGGAYINCWVKTESEATAKLLAEKYIGDCKWQILNLMESRVIDLEKERHESDYLEQAKIDGEVYSFHTWPIESEDEESSQ